MTSRRFEFRPPECFVSRLRLESDLKLGVCVLRKGQLNLGRGEKSLPGWNLEVLVEVDPQR